MLCHLRVCFTLTLVLLPCSAAFAQGSDRDLRPRTASLSGRVMIEGKYAANVTVTMVEEHRGIREVRIFSSGGQEFIDPLIYKSTTDSEGRYQFKGLPTGIYQISPKAMAHVPESKLLGPYASTRILLDEGEARENIDFTLVRGGVITGRVIDEDGRPQIRKFVRLIELKDQDNQPEVSNIYERSLETDDRGIFRIFGLRKGRYIVGAGGEHEIQTHPIGKRTQVTYHPDVIKHQEAKVIEITEGREVTGVDIKLRNSVEADTFTVSGKVINSETGKPLPQINVTFIKVENQDDEDGNQAGDSITDADGNFTATGLKAGKYKARLFPVTESGGYYSEGKYFEVSDSDVSGVNLLARRGATINGVVIVEEGRDESVQAKLSQMGLRAFIRKEYFVGNVPHYTNVGWLHTKIGSDGSFRLVGAPPGKLGIEIPTFPFNTIYLLRIERNGIDVSEGLEVSAGEDINGVRVIVGQGSGAIRGSLRIVGGTFPEGLYLSAWAAREGSPHIGRSSEVDEKGRFLIEGLLSGEYSLSISWGTRNNNPVDPNLKIPRPPKQSISVRNGAETQVNLTIDLRRDQ